MMVDIHRRIGFPEIEKVEVYGKRSNLYRMVFLSFDKGCFVADCDVAFFKDGFCPIGKCRRVSFSDNNSAINHGVFLELELKYAYSVVVIAILKHRLE